MSRYFRLFWFFAALIGFSVLAIAQSFSNNPGYVSHDLTEPGSFTSGIEGPAVDAEGNLYVVNYQRQHTIGKITPGGSPEMFVELPDSSIGNGIRFSRDGRMLIADYINHKILAVDTQTQQVEIFCHVPEMNQPNDLAISGNDILFASDPDWAGSSGNLWRIDSEGTATLLEYHMGTTNGIEVGPGDSLLYVNESVQRNVWVYDLSPQGQVSHKRLLIHFDDYGMDGMRSDTAGNLYICRYGKGTIALVNPSGELIREVPLTGKKPSNIAFGGPDGKTCYVTLQDRGCVEYFRSEIPGRSWHLWENFRKNRLEY